jgi:hypothetical protein
VEQTNRYWQALNQRFGDYSTWIQFPVGCEYYGYYVFAMQDSQRCIDFFKNSSKSFLLAGGWSHQTYEGMLAQSLQFDHASNSIIWMHSRKLQDPRCLELTKSVLTRHGIDSVFVDSVFHH